ncbi:MAG TPA: hypothetical protein VFN21_05280, partial [Acidimicrobiales bacterium]|nr:hypothetical protein [Acidimicrobiales bacterium]
VLTTERRGVNFVVQPKQEHEFTGTDKNGKAKYRTRHWLEITNSGDADAENLRFESVGETSTMHLVHDDAPTIVHAGQTRTVAFFHMGSGGPPVLRITWTEGDEDKRKDFHVG